jgi:site-specific recombinase XerD
MSHKWKKTAHPGLRYREHDIRKHGKKPDRYYAVRFRLDKELYEYGIGWLSDGIPEAIRVEEPGIGFEEYCLKLLRQYKANVKTGEGPISPKEKRAIEKKKREQAEQAKKQAEKDNITLHDYFYDIYYPDAQINKKESSYSHEETHFRLWIDPIAGRKPFKDLSEFDARRIVKKLFDAGKTPRTAQYVMATIRQAWNKARRGKIVSGDSPTLNVKIPKFDNRRQRFLNHDEANQLLVALKEKDETLHNMALLSLHTGMRASEIFKLTWGCIDTDRGLITILDAKSGKGRAAFMTEQVKNMFAEMTRGTQDEFVFTRSDKMPYSEIPRLFRDIVTNLKFNEHVHDNRQRVCFHSLRHTMASWHAEGGTDLYVLKELLGHGSITLTERYSHLSNSALQAATREFEKKAKAATKKAGQVVDFQK